MTDAVTEMWFALSLWLFFFLFPAFSHTLAGLALSLYAFAGQSGDLNSD